MKFLHTGGMTRLIDDLNTLHDGFVEAINLAVADERPRPCRPPRRRVRRGGDHDDRRPRGQDRTCCRSAVRATDSGLRARIRRLTASRTATASPDAHDPLSRSRPAPPRAAPPRAGGHRHHDAKAERRQRLAQAHRPLDARPAHQGAAAHQTADADQHHDQERCAPSRCSARSSACSATPPANIASAVRTHARNVRSLARVKRGSGSSPASYTQRGCRRRHTPHRAAAAAHLVSRHAGSAGGVRPRHRARRDRRPHLRRRPAARVGRRGRRERRLPARHDRPRRTPVVPRTPIR